MADAATWARRVSEWRRSGLTSQAFSAGRDFSAGGVRHWAYRLGKTRKQTRAKPVRMARVLRVAAAAPRTIVAPAVDAPIVVELGVAKVSLRAGFDRATLDAVLDVLAARVTR